MLWSTSQEKNVHAGTHSRQSKDVKECACSNTRRAKTRQNLPTAIPRKLYLCFFGGCAFSKSSVSIFFERLSPSARLYEGSCQAYLGILQQASMRRWALACESLSRCRGKSSLRVLTYMLTESPAVAWPQPTGYCTSVDHLFMGVPRLGNPQVHPYW